MFPSNLKSFINPFKAAQVEVEIITDCLVDGVTYSKGDRVAFNEQVSNNLVAMNRAIDHSAAGKAQSKKERLALLLPKMEEVEPLPDNWQKLPKPFAAWWKLNQKGLVIMNHRDEIEARLIKLLQMDLRGSFGDLENLSVDNKAMVMSRGISINIGANDPVQIESENALRNALRLAAESYIDWCNSNYKDLVKLKFECSDFMQLSHGILRKENRSLHSLALDLFTTRISSLGLGSGDIRRLFAQSADAVKYAAIEVSSLPELRLAWSDKSETRFFVDSTVAAMVCHINLYEGKLAEVQRLTKEVTTELSKTKRALAAA